MKTSKTKKHPIKKWVISIMEIQNHKGKKFKVTRRLPELFVSETKIFKTKRRAQRQCTEWLK